MIIKIFKLLLGTGRAWRLMGDNIKALSEAVCEPFNEIRRAAYRILYAPFLTQNRYATAQEKLDDVENYEKQFGLTTISNVLIERQANAEVQWALVGGQGFGYIENVLAAAGINAKIIENIPAKDLTGIGGFEYGEVQYGETVNEHVVQYGASGYVLIANGLINTGETIEDPCKITDWSKVFIVEVLEPITYGQYQTFINILLKTRPAEMACLAKVNLY